METFLEKYDLLKLTQRIKQNMNSSVMSKEICSN